MSIPEIPAVVALPHSDRASDQYESGDASGAGGISAEDDLYSPGDESAQVASRWVEPGVVYLVATPIGNLADMTERAIAVLRGVDAIACEDTRHVRKLLDHFGVRNRVFSLHEHNEAMRSAEIGIRLSAGESIALVSDAGTPAISDPGSLLVRTLKAQGHRVSPIPGACAAIAALSASGLDSTHFWFEGFLPAKTRARESRLQALATGTSTLVFYEAPHRIQAMVSSLKDVLGGAREAVLARELTKRFESLDSGTLESLNDALAQGVIPARGEFVVLVAGTSEQQHESEAQIPVDLLLETLLAEQAPPSMIARVIARLSSRKRNDVYNELLKRGRANDA